MIMRKITAILGFVIANCVNVIAQQSPIYSQYILNEFIINPATAGIDGMTSINFSARKQWVGWENAPSTFTACASARILKTSQTIKGRTEGPNRIKKGASGRVGLGASLLDDNNGAISRLGLNLTYSYHIFIQNSQLSFGLSFLAQQFKIDENLADFDPMGIKTDDPLDGLLGKSSYIPDAAFGLNFSSRYYNIGCSVFQLLQSPVKFGNTEATMHQLKQVRQYNVMGTYHRNLKSYPDWEYEPSLIFRATENLQTSADLSLRFIYNREYWAGLSYRTSGDFILLLGVKLNRLYFGYSFDYGFNELSRNSYGSHEIMMAIKLGDSARRYRYWERY
jgi:type IX secretion system PorP/SprF family membrane protein